MVRMLLVLGLLLGSMGRLPGQHRWQRFKALSGPERCWVLSHPFVASKAMLASQRALAQSREVAKREGLFGQGNGGQMDALRHSLWMALLAREIGARRARKLGLAHEKGNYKDFRKEKLEDGAWADAKASEMDLWNNEQGLAVARLAISGDQALVDTLVARIRAGKMRILAQDGKGNFLDARGQVLRKENWSGKWHNDRCLVPSDRVPTD